MRCLFPLDSLCLFKEAVRRTGHASTFPLVTEELKRETEENWALNPELFWRGLEVL